MQASLHLKLRHYPDDGDAAELKYRGDMKKNGHDMLVAGVILSIT
jgi:hypothetical protein